MKKSTKIRLMFRPYASDWQAGITHHFILGIVCLVFIGAIGSFFELRAGAAKLDGAIVSGYSNKCLAVPSKAVAGSKVTVQSCGSDTATQAWQSANGDTSIRIQGLCLGLAASGTIPNGTPAVLAACKQGSFEQWIVDSGRLRNAQADKCLAVNSSASGTNAVVEPCGSGTGQKWSLQNPSTDITGARGVVRSSLTNSQKIANLCMDDAHNSTAAGTAVQVWTCNNNPSQTWTVYSDATIRIHALCLATSDNTQTAGAAVIVAACNNTASEAWTKGANDAVVNVASGRCLTSDSATARTKLRIENCNASANQAWIVPVNNALSIAPPSTVEPSTSATENAAVQTAEQHDLQYLLSNFRPSCSQVKSAYAKQQLHC